MKQAYEGPMERIDDCRWRIPKSYKPGMKVDGIIYADDRLIESIRGDNAAEQVANVAFLPGIQQASLAMPDIHWGYGFPIGGVAATDPAEGGVVSPGGVGYDINCGVRLVRTSLTEDDAKKDLQGLVAQMFRDIPAGVGRGGAIKFGLDDEKRILKNGSRWVVEQGFGRPKDIDHTEEGGAIKGADPDTVSDRALQRGRDQCGTLGSGNHFVEVQVVEEILDEEVARVFGLARGMLTVMIHSGSRGLGHQVCDDNLKMLRRVPGRFGIQLPDQQLICAPVDSSEGQRYLDAMRAAANFAWANRQILMHLVRQVFERFFKASPGALGMELVYDVAHNMAKLETHDTPDGPKELCIHRKGATRAFPAGRPEIPEDYRDVGQPVIIPGDMGRASYVLVGLPGAMKSTFGSTCHGAGRMMSRGEAIRRARGRSIKKELAEKGIVALARGRNGLDEEQPAAYKDVNLIVDVVEKAGLSRKVAKMRPLGVIKG